MRPRSVRLEERPHRAPWLRVTVEGAGTYTLRVPRDGIVQRLMAGWGDAADLAEQEEIAARLIAKAWDDEAWEIDAADPAESLYGAGWSSAAILLVAARIAQVVTDRQPSEEEVSAVVAFTEAPGQTASGRSGSLTATSETLSPGTP